MFNARRIKSRLNFNSLFSRPNNTLPDSIYPSRKLPFYANLGSFDFTANKAFIIVFSLIILLGLFLLFRIFSIGASTPSSSSIADSRSQLPEAKASQNIDKEFAFPLRDQKGAEISKLKVTLQSAELRDQIIVKAQKVTAISGRTFLVLNLKITNEYNKTIQINTRDYFRLSLNNNDKELLAPEIHNDPVEAQASSVKYTKIAFAINDSDKNLKLRVGELSSDQKTVIDLNLK